MLPETRKAPRLEATMNLVAFGAPCQSRVPDEPWTLKTVTKTPTCAAFHLTTRDAFDLKDSARVKVGSCSQGTVRKRDILQGS